MTVTEPTRRDISSNRKSDGGPQRGIKGRARTIRRLGCRIDSERRCGDLAITFPVVCVGVFAAERFVGIDAVQVTEARDGDRTPSPFRFGPRELLSKRFEPRFLVGDRAVDDEFGTELHRELTIFQGLTEVGISEVGGWFDEAGDMVHRVGAAEMIWGVERVGVDTVLRAEQVSEPCGDISSTPPVYALERPAHRVFEGGVGGAL